MPDWLLLGVCAFAWHSGRCDRFHRFFKALSASCTKLAVLADAFWSGAATPNRLPTNLEFAVAYDGFMSSLELSRGIWGAVRAGRAGPTSRSMQLLALIEQLDDIARTLVTLREEFNLIGQQPWFDEFRAGFAALIDALSQLTREMAEAVAVRGRDVDPTPLQHVFQKLDSALAAGSQRQTLFQREELERTTKHLVEQASALAETVSELNSGQPSFREPPEARFGPRPERFDSIAEIRNNLSLRSSSFRHALRLGVATALAALVASTVHMVQRILDPDDGRHRAETKFRRHTATSRATNDRDCSGSAAGGDAASGFNEPMVAAGCSGCSCFCHLRFAEPQLHSVCARPHSDGDGDA